MLEQNRRNGSAHHAIAGVAQTSGAILLLMAGINPSEPEPAHRLATRHQTNSCTQKHRVTTITCQPTRLAHRA